ncbi:hypothetical protein TPHA_0B04720 [Tetrapisispora phaffii CBS 4417]|uniref:PSP1 C-terminal domain-containing protein n=1 Tax=Tetrapisispora phaffii (strain ATCC 24235 / CBS 4417 / NBRC 1672 / NRRL Y-8282 / UCD 70-5) TaxID=1071381 RepID=G8BQ60_TETPH|nr:hypothetical protein TPHA_0B04720 [Tetrapisispora phaffii CBS 4417]CCE62141.1 hypothetical protein TPHA_0B04720 [Tetrapisispora phaffii CBS 4417]
MNNTTMTHQHNELPSVNSNTSLSDNLQLNNYYDKLLFKNNSGKSLVDLPSKLNNSNNNSQNATNGSENNSLFRNYISKIDNANTLKNSSFDGNNNTNDIASSNNVSIGNEFNEVSEEDPISGSKFNKSTFNDFDLSSSFRGISLNGSSHISNNMQNNNPDINFRNNSISVLPGDFNSSSSNDALHNFPLVALEMTTPSNSEPFPMAYNNHHNMNNNGLGDSNGIFGSQYNATSSIHPFSSSQSTSTHTNDNFYSNGNPASNLQGYSGLFNFKAQLGSSNYRTNDIDKGNDNNDAMLNLNIENARRSSYISDSLIHGQTLQNNLESVIDHLNNNNGLNQYNQFNGAPNDNNRYGSNYMNYSNDPNPNPNSNADRIQHRNSVFTIPTHQATSGIMQARNYTMMESSNISNHMLQQSQQPHQTKQQQQPQPQPQNRYGYAQNYGRNQSFSNGSTNMSMLNTTNNSTQHNRFSQYNQHSHQKNQNNNHNIHNKYQLSNPLSTSNASNNDNADIGLTVFNGRQLKPNDELKQIFKECGSNYFSSELVFEFTDHIKRLLDKSSEDSELKQNCIKFLNFLKSCNSNYVTTTNTELEKTSSTKKNAQSDSSSYMNYEPLALVTLKNGKLELLSIPNNSNLFMSRGDMVIIDGDRGKDLALMVEPAVSFDLALFVYFLKKKIHFDSLITAKSQHYPNKDFVKALIESTRGQSDKLNSRLYDVVELTQLVVPSKQVIRFATPWEVSSNLNNKLKDELKALHVAKMKLSSINNSHLDQDQASTEDMNSQNLDLNVSNTTSNANSKLNITILNAEIQFDRKKLTFYYICDERNDFRDLIKELFKLYKTRIWLCAIPNNLEIYSKYYNSEKKELHLYQQMMQNYTNEDMLEITNNNIHNNNNNILSPFKKIELDNFQIGVYIELVKKLFE